MKAIPYIRWSSREQSHGSSKARQQDIISAYIERQGWEVQPTIRDEGTSAWTGANIKTGNLGKFADVIRASGGEGLVLVIEQLDRLSRQPPIFVMNWISELCEHGLTIATGNDGQIINRESLRTNQGGLFLMVATAFRAFAESEDKSKKVTKAWEEKRKSGKPMTARTKGWLRLKSNRSAYAAIPERAAVVQRIFDLHEQGLGKGPIAALLNEEGVPCFGGGKQWHDSYILKLLGDRAVIGEHQPCRKAKTDLRPIPVGDPVMMFPPIIEIEQFERVNDARRKNMAGNAGKGGKLANLFSGLAKCHECGATMNYRCSDSKAKRAGGKTVLEASLVCSAGRLKAGCKRRVRFNYPKLECAILDNLLHLAMDDKFFAQPVDTMAAERELANVRRELEAAEKRRESVLRLVEMDAEDEFAVARYLKLKAEIAALAERVRDAQAKLEKVRGSVTATQHRRRVAATRADMSSSNEVSRFKARADASMAIADIIDLIEFSGEHEQAVVMLKEGVRAMVIDRRGNVIGDYRTRPELRAGSLNSIVRSYYKRQANAA